MEQLNNAGGGNSPFTEALTTVRCAKNVFLTVMILSLLIQLAGFVMVRFTKLVAEPVSAMAAELAPKHNLVQTAATAPASGEATTMAAAATSEPTSASAPVVAAWHKSAGHHRMAQASTCTDGYKTWYHVFRWLLPATMFLAMISGALLLLTLMFTVKLSLLARTPGVEGYLSSFFWAMLLWVLLIPWQQMMDGRFLYGATFTLEELIRQTRTIFWEGNDTIVESLTYYLRFMFYPILALVIALYVQCRYALGVRRMTMAVSQADVPPGGAEKM